MWDYENTRPRRIPTEKARKVFEAYSRHEVSWTYYNKVWFDPKSWRYE